MPADDWQSDTAVVISLVAALDAKFAVRFPDKISVVDQIWAVLPDENPRLH